LAGQNLELLVSISLDTQAEAPEVDAATFQLQHELLELDVESVERPMGERPPPGARAAELTELATLLVSLGPALITGVAGAIAQWVARDPSRSVKLEMGGDSIEVTSVSEEDQQRLVGSFLAKHAGAGDEPTS
jgi:hypothetical protein